MTPSRQERIGRHEVALYPDQRGGCGLVRVAWCGDVATEEARAVVDVFAPHVATDTPIFVTDLSRLGKMPFGAIRALAGADLPQPSIHRYFRLGYSVANLRTKVMMSIILRTAALTTRDTFETAFFDLLDDAMDWGRAELAKT